MTSLRELLASVGFHGKGLDTAVAVAMAESGGHPTSHNTNAGTGDNSYGLFQINMLGSLGPARLQEYHLSSNNQLFDPLTNARVAYKMSDGGTNWTPWSTYKRGDYLKYLGKDMQVDGAVPDPNADPLDDPSAGAGHPAGSDGFDISDGQSLTALHANQAQLRSQLDYVVGRGPLPEPVPHVSTTAAHSSMQPDGDALHTFLQDAQSELGKSYVFGAKAAPTVDHPNALDCSGLTKWAAGRAGADLPDGAAHQFLALKKAGMLIPVDQAMHTPGALLFHFAAEPQPGQGEPEIAHVAISKGNGMTIEAADEQDGIVSWKASGRFNYAAVIPGIGTTDPSDVAHAPLSSAMHPLDGMDGLSDDGSTDDPFSLTGAHSGGLGHGVGTADTMQEGIDFDEHYGGWDLGHH